MMKLVEERAGTGELKLNGKALREVRYRIRRYQGMAEGSGLPIPGLYRIDGSIEMDSSTLSVDFIGTPLDLRLEDGRVVGIIVDDGSGRILSEGHGPTKCLCC